MPSVPAANPVQPRRSRATACLAARTAAERPMSRCAVPRTEIAATSRLSFINPVPTGVYDTFGSNRQSQLPTASCTLPGVQSKEAPSLFFVCALTTSQPWLALPCWPWASWPWPSVLRLRTARPSAAPTASARRCEEGNDWEEGRKKVGACSGARRWAGSSHPGICSRGQPPCLVALDLLLACATLRRVGRVHKPLHRRRLWSECAVGCAELAPLAPSPAAY